MAISYDSLELNISANVSGASRGIRALQRNLEALQNTVKGLDFGLIESLQKHLQDIANIDFSNVSQGLKDVVSAFRALNNAKLKGKGGLEDRPYEPNFTMQDSQLPAIFQPNWQEVKTLEIAYNGFKESVEKGIDDSGIIEVEAHFKTLEGELERAGFSYEQIKEVMRSTNAEAKLFSEEGLTQVKNILIDLGRTAEEADRIINRLKTDVEGNVDTSKWDKLLGAFKRIAFYRVVRRALQLLFQEIANGFKELVKVDEQFNQSISQLKSSFSNVARAFVSALAPIINVLAPIVKMLSDVLVNLLNKISATLSKIFGSKQINQAKTDVEDYAKSLKKVKDASLGIDELNVLKADDESDYFETFENLDAGQGLASIGEGITEILKPIGQVLDTLQPIFDLVSGLFVKLTPLFRLVSTFLKGVVGLLQPIIDTIGTIISTITELVEPILDRIMESINESAVFFTDVVKMMFESFENSFKFFANIFKAICALLKGDWQALWDSLKGIVLAVINGVIIAFETMINLLVMVINGITSMLSKVWTWLGIPAIPEIPKANLGRVSFAQGGFPEDGFFFANHNELVGQFSNGKTAVANNEQITEGIYRAVRQALTEGVNTSEVNRDIIVQIDGREIGRASEKYQRQLGAKIFSGGSGYGN